MRAVVQCALALVVVAMTVPVGTDRVDTAAVSLPLTSDIESIAPSEGAVVGVAHPVVVTFTKPVTNRSAVERAIGVKSTPARTGKFEWVDNNVAQWVPDQYWPSHSTVKLSVAGMRTEFQTGPAVIGVASISKHTFTVTIDGVGEEPPVPLPAPHHLPHSGEEGVLLASMGRPEYPTPVGQYTVLSKERSVTMDSSSVGIPVTAPDGYLLEVDYAVRFTRRGLFVHSAPWAVPSMGLENVSHGCVSLIPAAAEWYFNTVNIGDPVIVEE
ncbi:lipoprotein-anchoring transpeptidase ErfK/SrfK [Mycobacterium frederiksbergense]|uniref:Lipoprotein-anchoring transpeptidase ErfK/SrfK n=1 Tax=Mycolicibacterium frederiksbergense TaxID=117567 RepID=A0ABT6KXR8_9MYCO|nr:L,D-transpeptidase [Mycolicibacterium frederiksbergense]MDH6195504.1 lipoprotein-anchoring transpeptidase ErfK/SrfK [Mycolicibacterium frederiksbergense]